MTTSLDHLLAFGPLGTPELIIIAILLVIPVAIIVAIVKLVGRKK